MDVSTLSSMLASPLSPSFLYTYSLSTSSLGCNTLCIVISFLVVVVTNYYITININSNTDTINYIQLLLSQLIFFINNLFHISLNLFLWWHLNISLLTIFSSWRVELYIMMLIFSSRQRLNLLLKLLGADFFFINLHLICGGRLLSLKIQNYLE